MVDIRAHHLSRFYSREGQGRWGEGWLPGAVLQPQPSSRSAVCVLRRCVEQQPDFCAPSGLVRGLQRATL